MEISSKFNQFFVSSESGEAVIPAQYDLSPSDLQLDTPHIKFGHINANSILSPDKLRSIGELISKYELDFCGVTETSLKPQNVNLYNLSGFSHFSKVRASRKNGGVSLFVRSGIPASEVLIQPHLDLPVHQDTLN
jgi:hypothetical protein